MAIEITGRHMDVSDAMKDYAGTKAQQLIDAFPRIENVHIILDIEKFRHLAEILVQGAHLRVEALETSDAMYASIDAAFEKIERQIRRVREKIQDSHRTRAKLPDVEQEMQRETEPK